MTIKFLKAAAVLAALLAPMSAYADMPNPGNSYQSCPAGTHSQPFPIGNGYQCVTDQG